MFESQSLHISSHRPKSAPKFLELARNDGRAHILRQANQNVQIVNRQQLMRQNLVGLDQVTHISAAKMRAGITAATLFNRARIFSVDGVAHVELALARERRPVPRHARR